MKVTGRDIEIMAWILEQKFMTKKQIRQVFWKNVPEMSRVVHKRLYKFQKAGLIKMDKKQTYRSAVYTVTAKGVRLLKELSRNRDLGELRDTDYTNYGHDLAVTDIRIMFYEWGYTHWLSERILSKRGDLRRIPDGMIFNEGKYIAVEYESSQKSKRRYREIFLSYEFDRHIDKVLYIVDTQELIRKISQEASVCQKIYFVLLEDLKKDLMSARLKGPSGECSLSELLEASG